MDEKTICRNIKNLRKQNDLTLEKLAELTGLTKGYLSKVERSEKAPPYSTLNKIAVALKIEVTRFFKKDIKTLSDIRISVQRKNNAPTIKRNTQISGYEHEILSADKPGKNMTPLIIYPSCNVSKMYSHEGEKFIYVMEGCLEFIYGSESYLLKAGDNVYFDSCVPHVGKSIGENRTKLLVVIYYYKRNQT